MIPLAVLLGLGLGFRQSAPEFLTPWASAVLLWLGAWGLGAGCRWLWRQGRRARWREEGTGMSKASQWARQFGTTVETAVTTRPTFRDRNGNVIGIVTTNGALKIADREEMFPVSAVVCARWILDTFQEDTPDA